MAQMTINELRHYVRHVLKDVYPPQEINSLISLILEKKVNLQKTELFLNRSKGLKRETIDEILKIIEELKKAVPIQYIFGETEFYDLTLEVDPSVLIPRQETEELVDWIIRENNKPNPKILDIGTGSGCIAIALAKNIPQSNVDALDFDEKILSLVLRNAQKNTVSINTIQADILTYEKDGQYDIIVSNPPYVLNSDKKQMHQNVLKYEPDKALFVPDSDALKFYKKIGEYAINHLISGGEIYFEINEKKGEQTRELLYDLGFQSIKLRKDINGKNRMIKAIKP